MRNAPFMTGPLSVLLDLVRLAAAFDVLAGHTVLLGLYSSEPPFTMAFQHNAVMVFFVVSGLVIATSVDNGGATLSSYAIARISRILPVAIPVLLFSAAVTWIDASLAVAVFKEDASGLAVADLILGALFLTESYRVGLPLNPPYWSLCYEVWYYALFAAATFLRGRKRVAWVAILAAVAGPNALLLLPVWLAGVAVARIPQARSVPPLLGSVFVALALISLAAVPMISEQLHVVLRSILPWALGYSLFALSDYILAIAIALGVVGLRAVTMDGLPLLEKAARPIRYVANMSFTLYLLHWPLIKLLMILGVPPSPSLLGIAAPLVVVLAICAAVASVTEQRRHAVRAWLERIIDGWRARRQPIATA